LEIARKGSRIVVPGFDDPEDDVSRAILELWPSENEKPSGRTNQELRDFQVSRNSQACSEMLET
jgi:hypothetical protein